MKLMLEAAADTIRVLSEPKPSCLLTGFGDNAINLELRVWINDPQNGLGVVRSELLMGVWWRFKENGIEMPYPQRVLHHKSIPEVQIRYEPKSLKLCSTPSFIKSVAAILRSLIVSYS